MNEKAFKKAYKPPACTLAPWDHLVTGPDREAILRSIRQETEAAYGYNMTQCPKRKVCFTKECLGRPLPWLSKTAKPYLEQLKATHTIKNDELYINNCGTCPIFKDCKSPCYQVNDYMNRHTDPSPELVFEETLENHEIEVTEPESDPIILNNNIPWDCLSDTKRQVVKKYIYEQKDFLTIAEELKLNNRARAKYEFYSALTRLSEFGAIRQCMADNQHILDEKHHSILYNLYYDNKTLADVAQDHNVSKQAVQQLIARLISKFNVKWKIFVYRKGKKLIYNVPKVLK